ncbi:hypothetical protein WG907_12800 [Sphingobium sp. AN558]|uniref:hypothetical protein n=1 Tax=Sphingobium sp. AN558 TaxID=3133442 RepID=UPI0030BEDBC5
MDEGVGTEEQSDALTRPQRRLLRRIFHNRNIPIVVEKTALLTYRDASRFLLSLPLDARDTAYAAVKRLAQGETR